MFRDNRNYLSEWTKDDWRVLEDLLVLDGFYLLHCIHCDRSNYHPACMIVPIEGGQP